VEVDKIALAAMTMNDKKKKKRHGYVESHSQDARCSI